MANCLFDVFPFREHDFYFTYSLFYTELFFFVRFSRSIYYFLLQNRFFYWFVFISVSFNFCQVRLILSLKWFIFLLFVLKQCYMKLFLFEISYCKSILQITVYKKSFVHNATRYLINFNKNNQQLFGISQLYLTSNVTVSDFNMGYSMTGTLERGCKKNNSFQMTHFAVIRRRDYDLAKP